MAFEVAFRGQSVPEQSFESYCDLWKGEPVSFVVPAVLPKGWNVTRLGALVEERNRKVNDRDFQPLSVTMDGVVPQLDHVAKTTHSDNRKLVRTGDLVINSRSDRKGAAGLAEMDGSVSQVSIVVEPFRGHPRYLHHLVRSIPFQEEFYRRGKGIHDDLWSTRYDELKRIEVPFPPQTIQQKIANFLDRATSRIDNLIDRKKDLLRLLEEKHTALVTQAVTKGLDPDVPMKDSGVEWLARIPEHWETVQVGYLADYINGYSFAPDDWEETGRPIIRIQDLTGSTNTTNYFNGELPEKYLVHEGDVLISWSASLGVYRWGSPKAGWLNQHIYKVLPNSKIIREDFFYWLSDWFMRILEHRMHGSAMKHVTQNAFESLTVPLPPKAEQKSIASAVQGAVTSVRRLRQVTEESARLFEEYREALITAAVTGKIDIHDCGA